MGAAVAIPLDVAFSLRLVSVLRRQRACERGGRDDRRQGDCDDGRVDPILTRSGHSSRYAIDIAWVRCFGPGQMVGKPEPMGALETALLTPERTFVVVQIVAHFTDRPS